MSESEQGLDRKIIGERLKSVRAERGLTLDTVHRHTGISTSTLSRLESGVRTPTLELILTLSRYYGMPVEELAGTTGGADPRIHLRPERRAQHTVVPLTHGSLGVRAEKLVFDGPPENDSRQRVHPGVEWFYVLRGHLALHLGQRHLVLRPGEAAEFNCMEPHYFGAADESGVEVLSIFSALGERIQPKDPHGENL